MKDGIIYILIYWARKQNLFEEKIERSISWIPAAMGKTSAVCLLGTCMLHAAIIGMAAEKEEAAAVPLDLHD